MNVKKNKLNDFNYIDHYQKDAVEFDYFAERKGATKHDERRVREYIISKVPENIKSILDVGCGSGWVANHYTEKGVKVHSLDISKINPSKAMQLYPFEGHFGIVADSFHLPFVNDSFDCVIVSEVIEHVVNPAEFIKEVFRVVKKSGKLIVTTPYKEKIIYYLCVHCNKKTPIHSHLHSFDEKMLERYYKDEDLESFKYETFGNKLLVFLRTYVILKFLPFWLWKIKDRIVNLIYNNPIHIICIYTKKS